MCHQIRSSYSKPSTKLVSLAADLETTSSNAGASQCADQSVPKSLVALCHHLAGLNVGSFLKFPLQLLV